MLFLHHLSLSVFGFFILLIHYVFYDLIQRATAILEDTELTLGTPAFFDPL